MTSQLQAVAPVRPARAEQPALDDSAAPVPGSLERARPRERRRTALRIWLAFDATMLGLRGVTLGQRTRILPLPDVNGGGIHIHHFVWGILILTVVGFVSLMSPDRGSSTTLALLFGIGLALVVDEFALWLTLSDVYWAPEGTWSIELAGVVATLLAGNTAWTPRVTGRHERPPGEARSQPDRA